MSSIIFLEITKKTSDSPAVAGQAGQPSGAPESIVLKSHTSASLQHAVSELEEMIKNQQARIRLIVDDLSDVTFTMEVIRSASSILYEHLMETMPADAIKGSYIKDFAASVSDAPLRTRVERYFRYNKLQTFLLIIFIIGVVLAMVPEFSKRMFQKMYSSRESIYAQSSLPFDSGWVLLGKFNESNQQYADGPHAIIIKNALEEKGTIIRAGDIIVLTRPRDVLIANYRRDGIGQILEQPWQSGSVSSNDYTGIRIKAGQKVKVLDIGYGISDTYLREIWARVANPEK